MKYSISVQKNNGKDLSGGESNFFMQAITDAVSLRVCHPKALVTVYEWQDEDDDEGRVVWHNGEFISKEETTAPSNCT